jgi:hypothetical protein
MLAEKDYEKKLQEKVAEQEKKLLKEKQEKDRQALV